MFKLKGLAVLLAMICISAHAQFNGALLGYVNAGIEAPWPYRVPEGYQELEWIADTNLTATQRIDIPWYKPAAMTAGTGMEVKIGLPQLSQITGSKTLFGSAEIAGARYWFGAGISTTNKRWNAAFGGTTGGVQTPNIVENTGYVLKFNGLNFTIDGVQKSQFPNWSRANVYQMPMFMTKSTTTAYLNPGVDIKIWYVKCFTTNVLVYSGVPVKRLSDNHIAMWDLVTETFQPNTQPQYPFVAGPEVNVPVE